MREREVCRDRTIEPFGVRYTTVKEGRGLADLQGRVVWILRVLEFSSYLGDFFYENEGKERLFCKNLENLPPNALINRIFVQASCNLFARFIATNVTFL